MTDLVRVSHGLWRPPGTVADLAGHVAACLAACPVGTVVCGLTAAHLHRLWLPEFGGPSVEVIVHPDRPVPASRPGGRRREIRARRQMLRDDEVVEQDGILVTSVARTWLDLGERLLLPDLVAAGDSALRAGARPDDLQVLVGRARHRRGIRRVRAAQPLLDGRSRSRPESHLRFAIVNGGLPVPEVNEPIFSASGEWLAEPDLSYEDVRLALEYNGADHADPRRMRRDITRELDVVDRGGWQSVTFGPAEVFGRPDTIPMIVRRLRADRAHQFSLSGAKSREWREISRH